MGRISRVLLMLVEGAEKGLDCNVWHIWLGGWEGEGDLGWMWMAVDIPFNECTSINASLSYLNTALG